MKLKSLLYLIQHMKEDIQNYSPTVMFRGTPCMSEFSSKHFNQLLAAIWKPALAKL